MIQIVALAGSLRSGSYNRALLRAAAELAPAGCTIEIGSLAGIPLDDGDLEATQGLPEAVRQLKERIATADGLLLASPEYNHSIPGVLKNALDWLSRPPRDIPAVFGDRPVALCGASSGAGGTRLAQAAWLPVFRALGLRIFTSKQLYVTHAGQVFDADGRLIDEETRKRATGFLEAFVRFIGVRDDRSAPLRTP